MMLGEKKVVLSLVYDMHLDTYQAHPSYILLLQSDKMNSASSLEVVKLLDASSFA